MNASWLFKQRSIGHVWGRFALAGTQISLFVTGYTFLMVSLNAYEPVAGWFQRHGVTLSLGVYLVAVVLPIVAAYVLSWKFLVKSFYLSWTEQFWRESKAYLDELSAIKAQMAEILDKLDKLEKRN